MRTRERFFHGIVIRRDEKILEVTRLKQKDIGSTDRVAEQRSVDEFWLLDPWYQTKDLGVSFA